LRKRRRPVSTSETGKAGTNAGSRDDALVRAHPWRSCAGSVEGTRGYTCGLWTLLHALAARAPGPEGGAAWFEKTTGWIEHFFPCDDCRAHFLAMAAEVPRGEIVTARDAQLWMWRAHNEVNARLAAREARGEGAGSGDPAFPKAQWPAYAACEACREVAAGAGANDLAGAGEAVRWDEEAVAAFLTVYFHGMGAPRLELGDGKSALGAPRGDEERFAREKNGGNGGKRKPPGEGCVFPGLRRARGVRREDEPAELRERAPRAAADPRRQKQPRRDITARARRPRTFRGRRVDVVRCRGGPPRQSLMTLLDRSARW
jgi:hypothetical protein